MSPQPPSSVEIVNRTFYAAPPHEYFRRRLLLLLTAADRRAELAAMWAQGVSYGDLTRQYQAPSDEADEVETLRFIAAESQVLAHHLFETLLRLFLAHADHPACPPLEVARLTQFAEFKRRVKARFLPEGETDPTLVQQIADFILGADAIGLPDEARARYHADAVEIEKFLRRFASVYLNGAHMYNGAKHGFVLAAGEHGFSISPDGQRAEFRISGSRMEATSSGRIPPDPDAASATHEGPAVAHLSRDDRKWSIEVDWIEIERSLLYCSLALDWLQTLWHVGRARRLDLRTGPLPALNVTFQEVEDSFPDSRWSVSVGLGEEVTPGKRSKR